MNNKVDSIIKTMSQITYGFKINNINIINNSKKWENEFNDFYYLQTPDELINSKCGVCFDQVELERKLLNKINIKTKTYFIYIKKDDMLPSHTFLTYKLNNKFYWFENSWNKYKGIHEYKKQKELIEDVTQKFLADHVEAKNYDNLYLYEYKTPKFHISCDEFYKYIETQKLIKCDSKKNIIIYDFDGTLTPYSLPQFEILEKIGIKNGLQNENFIKKVKEKMQLEKINFYQAIYKQYFQELKNKDIKVDNNNLTLGYDKIKYNNGVIEFLKMLEKNNIKNYLLSSGIKVYLEKVSIAKYFKNIYATTFLYDKHNEIQDFDFLMSDINEVTAIKNILYENKLEANNCSNVIYIGDGLTDYYAMEYVKKHGGTTIFVYNDKESQSILDIKEKGVVSLFSKADFSKNSELENYIKNMCKINY